MELCDFNIDYMVTITISDSQGVLLNINIF